MDPIEKAYIYGSGDPSVGINGTKIIVDGLYIDPECISGDPKEQIDFIEENRGILKECFGNIIDDHVQVIFDFEMEQIENMYQEMENITDV